MCSIQWAAEKSGDMCHCMSQCSPVLERAPKNLSPSFRGYIVSRQWCVRLHPVVEGAHRPRSEIGIYSPEGEGLQCGCIPNEETKRFREAVGVGGWRPLTGPSHRDPVEAPPPLALAETPPSIAMTIYVVYRQILRRIYCIRCVGLYTQHPKKQEHSTEGHACGLHIPVFQIAEQTGRWDVYETCG